MYDNIDFKIRGGDRPDIDFLAEVPNYIDVIGEHSYDNGDNGDKVVTGRYKQFEVAVSRRGVSITKGSLCKYFLGDNFQTLGRSDVQRAIEKMSDELHLPVADATISRIDLAQNFIMKYPLEVYLNHLGDLKNAGRAPIGKGNETLYYYLSSGLLVFYDKVKEQKGKGQQIPELYKDRHVLRYEQRYTSRLPKTFGVERVTAAMLYTEPFYIGIINRWRDNYISIKKINDTSINFGAMTTIKDYKRMCFLDHVLSVGGELSFIQQVNEAYNAGQLGKRQADEFKREVRDACKVKEGLTVKNEAILELDKKVNEAVRYYR
jgi:hypothetical protein